MGFEAASIWQDFKQASATERGTVDDNSNQVLLGPRLNEAVRHFANGYLERLELGPAHKGTDERAKLLDLQWGRIEHDGALLRGLGAALTNFAEVLGANVTKLGESWKGESYDAFKAAMDKVRQTTAAYGTYATATGDGLVDAMSQLRVVFEQFAQDSANTHLNFSNVSAPERWHKVGEEPYTAEKLTEACNDIYNHGSLIDYNLNCVKNDDAQAEMINGRLITERRWDIVKVDPCEDNDGRVQTMYRNMIKECDTARDGIKTKLDKFFDAVDATVDTVSAVYGAALGNVYTLANEEVFSSLRVLGAGGGGQPVGGGDTSAPGGYPGDTHPGSAGGGYPGGGGGPGPAAVAEPEPPAPEEPEPEEPPAEDTAPADAAPDPAAREPEPSASVEVKDGDRTIGVTSPDGEGRVRVTVDDGTGNTKTYELDFDAASGLAPQQPGTDEPGPRAGTADGAAPEQVPARTDGKCVIQDGPLTITAERPLFSPDSIQLTVDDGSGNPTTYTLDFEEERNDAEPEDTPEAEAPASASGGAPRPGTDQAVAATPSAPPTDEAVPEDAEQRTDSGGNGAGTTAREGAAPAPAAGEPEQDQPAQTTTQRAVGTPQAPAAAADGPSQPGWLGDRESMSGVLVPDQPEGEAGLPAAADDPRPDASGMAGAGMPMMGGGAPATGGSEPGRVGSGWSVHGDLFDSGEPVYSMHGVLGDEDQATE